MSSNYKDLIVWQKAMDLTVMIYELVKKLPKSETYALSDQMRRAGVSVPSNIAEGQERNSDKDFVRFLLIAQGSKSELETQLLIGQKVGYFTEFDISPILQLSNEIGRMLNALISKKSGHWPLESGNSKGGEPQ
jgi:four helix bundle protein